ncbi:uncharacterized protein LOC128996427 [Macrosteles quadrilineatus]|uniref:uncharacterized protein LOC128996427 n=1 Tax=Macrosteles quadrilineatus TaxID=74068 RepID=UPI0023E209B1|nr:uncharacterized protein LOC128996427 [Macrosteles quadrilineatus]
MLLRAIAITLVLAALEVTAFPWADPAKLRRIPRIYNALITSDEQLLPSQAYPAVAPVLRPAPLAPYPYSYPYGAPYTVYAPDPYGLQAYSRLPGFNDTLQDPEAPAAPAQNPQLFSLQPQQTIPQVTDQVKNNRPGNPDIPDVPPPPLPVSPPRSPDDKSPERKPGEYPPAPSQGLPFL